MTTIRAVAREANVSPSTVSLVLNGGGRVSEATKKRVVSVMERLRYAPRRVGRPVATSKVHHVGIVYTSRVLAHGALSQLTRSWINGIRDELVKAGDHSSVFGGAPHVDDDLMLQQVLEAGEVAAMILVGVSPQDGYLQRVLAAGLPTVVMNRRPKYAEFSYVTVDNYGGGRQAVEHLYAKGHRQLAMISSALGGAEFVTSRRAGAEDAARRLGIELKPSLALDPDADTDDISHVCREVTKSGASGVFVTADHVAAECATQWAADGIRLGEDLSVIGFDDLGVEVETGRKLSSIGFDKEEMGRQAARMIRSLLDDTNPPVSAGQTFGTGVVSYDTVGSVPHQQAQLAGRL